MNLRQNHLLPILHLQTLVKKHPPLNSKQLKSLKKKKKYRVNWKKINDVHVEFVEYISYIRSIKRLVKDTEQIMQPSYSMMHSLTDGYSIVLYTGTHNGGTTNDLLLCRNAAVRLILSHDMIVMWRENLLHSGAKLRNKTPSNNNRQGIGLSPITFYEQPTITLRSNVKVKQEVKEDFRFFAYVKATPKKGITRLKDRAPTADCSSIYRLVGNVCQDFDKASQCQNCSEGAKVIELSNIKGYQTGETIIGNLVFCGWVVLRGVEVSDETNNKLEQ